MPDEMNKDLSAATDGSVKERAHETQKFSGYVKTLMNNAFSYSLLLDREAKILCYSDSFLNLLEIPDGSVLIGMPLSDVYKLFITNEFAGNFSGSISVRPVSGSLS